MILEDYRRDFKAQLNDIYPPEEITAITSIALQYVLGKNRVEISLSRKQEITPSQRAQLNGILKRLQQSEPIQYITGSTEFYGLELQVNRATLIPRPETEELVDWIVKDYKTQQECEVLDIGTGSGCIAIAIAKNLDKATVEAVDISLQALETATANAANNEVVVRYFQQDILEARSLPKPYNVIVSNPPYVRNLEKSQIKDNVLQYEPHQALFVPDTDPLLFYRQIGELALTALKPNGALYLEINQYLVAETKALLYDLGYNRVFLKKDFSDNFRMIKASL